MAWPYNLNVDENYHHEHIQKFSPLWFPVLQWKRSEDLYLLRSSGKYVYFTAAQHIIEQDEKGYLLRSRSGG